MSTTLERRPRFRVTPKEWLAPAEMTFAQWREAGRRLGILSRGSQWWIGDWIRFGADAYGEKYAEAVEITGYDVGSLMDMAWVASVFETSRRREDLSWSHHKEVAGLETSAADELLEEAATTGWSMKRLRRAVKERRGADRAGAITPTGQSLLLELGHPGGSDQVASALAQLCDHAERLGFAVLERPDLSAARARVARAAHGP